MTTVLAAQPLTLQPLTLSTNGLVVQMDTSGSPQEDPSQRRLKIEPEDKDKSRGRRKNRPGSQHKDGAGAGGDMSPVDGADGVEEHSSGTEEPSRKRRRSRKGLDKKFLCPQEGCGKSYSRAEHL